MVYVRGFLTNRSFDQVDKRFSFRLGDEIRHKAKSKSDMTVCDIACGTEAVAINDLAVDHPRIKVVGLDYNLAEEYRDDRRNFVRGDLFDVPFENVADVTYCANVIADMLGYDGERSRTDIARAVRQISKTLISGGVAFIDDACFACNNMLLDYLAEEIKRQDPLFYQRYAIGNDPKIGLMGNYIIVNRLE